MFMKPRNINVSPYIQPKPGMPQQDLQFGMPQPMQEGQFGMQMPMQQSPFPMQMPMQEQPQQPFMQSPMMMGQQQQMYAQMMSQLEPVVQYGLREAQVTGFAHAIREIALISFLMGRGLDFAQARRIVESMEVNETFPSPLFRGEEELY